MLVLGGSLCGPHSRGDAETRRGQMLAAGTEPGAPGGDGGGQHRGGLGSVCSPRMLGEVLSWAVVQGLGPRVAQGFSGRVEGGREGREEPRPGIQVLLTRRHSRRSGRRMQIATAATKGLSVLKAELGLHFDRTQSFRK